MRPSPLGRLSPRRKRGPATSRAFEGGAPKLSSIVDVAGRPVRVELTYLGPLQSLFGTTAIQATDWGRIVLVASSVLLLVELEKAWYRRRVGKSGGTG